ncbi:zinc ribbon domain-containing protein [Ruminococcus sp. Marseille-P6503]|uniref:zinc ribbon domain-containing protein n=1 Tax=Ruminococcus sp. Marseille-P6503 TaxID=2364796 RepID=UPI000F532AFD|nr:zinc ribbon domain-containing protein [Ruminococcus sp. Marseille-P6503]
MGRICQSCHARIDEGMKICPNCGRIVPAEQKREGAAAYQPAPKRVYEHPKRRTPPAAQAQPCSAKVSGEGRKISQPAHTQERGHKKQGSRLGVLWKFLKAALIVLAVYAVIFAVQVFRIRHSSYDFSLDMKMTRENYGEVIDEYFESGSWSYNPFTFTATYTGENLRNEEYEIKFKAVLGVDIKSIEIDGEQVRKDDFETKIMGMFI